MDPTTPGFTLPRFFCPLLLLQTTRRPLPFFSQTICRTSLSPARCCPLPASCPFPIAPYFTRWHTVLMPPLPWRSLIHRHLDVGQPRQLTANSLATYQINPIFIICFFLSRFVQFQFFSFFFYFSD